MFPQLHTWGEIHVQKTTRELKPGGGAHGTGLPQAPQEGMSCPGPQFPAAAVTNGHKPGAYNNRNASSHTPEARSLRSGHCRATLPPEAPREGPSLDLVASGGPRHPLVGGGISAPAVTWLLSPLCVFSSSISNLPLLPLTRTPVIGLRAHPGNPG